MSRRAEEEEVSGKRDLRVERVESTSHGEGSKVRTVLEGMR